MNQQSQMPGTLGWRWAVGHVGHVADICSTLLMAPHLASSSWTHHASGCKLLHFFTLEVPLVIEDSYCVWQTRRTREVTPVPS